MTRIAVIGTGTAVGKTHATRALTLALAHTGAEVAALKPIESGVGAGPTDFDLLARAGTFSVAPPPYAFPDALSPHLAARRARRPVRIDVVADWVRNHPARWTFIETAGALLSPLSLRTTNLDLVVELDCAAVVLVAQDRLGVLHELRACTLALRVALPDIPLLVLLQPPARPDTSTGVNADEVRRLGIARQVHSLPRHASPDHPSVQVAAGRALRALARLTGPASRPPTR